MTRTEARVPRAQRRGASTSSRRRLATGLGAMAFILPALLFYLVFMVVPIVGTSIISLFHWSGLSFSNMQWAGVSNYVSLTHDWVFWGALAHTFEFILVAGTANVVVGLLLAVLLEQGLKGSNFFRGTFFIPTVLSLVIVGLVFSFMLSPDFGIVNPILKSIGLGHFAFAWLGDPKTALPTVMVTEVWKDFGFTMFLFVAGLKGIDVELYEAATIDGANERQTFWRITMPMLWSVTTTIIVLVSINILKLFDLVYVMTTGGPNHASEVLTTWMYYQGFMYNRMGYGSSIAIFLLIITFLLTALQLKVLSRGRDQ